MNAVLRTNFISYSLCVTAFSIPRFFLSGKLLHTKKQTPAVLKAHRGLMAIPILFLFQGTTASRHRHQRLDAMR